MYISSKFQLDALYDEEVRYRIFNLNLVEKHGGVSRFDGESPKENGDTRAFLVAVNGRSLVIVPCWMEKGDVLGPVRWDILKMARKIVKKSDGILRFKMGRRWVKIGTSNVLIPRLENKGVGKFPNTETLFTEISDEFDTVGVLNVSPDLFCRTSRAMGNPEGMIMKFRKDNGPVEIRPEGSNRCNTVGLLMPRREG